MKFLVGARSVEGQRQRCDEADIVDGILRSVEDVSNAAGTEFGGDPRLVRSYSTGCSLQSIRYVIREVR